jgi:hypothetical protein
MISFANSQEPEPQEKHLHYTLRSPSLTDCSHTILPREKKGNQEKTSMNDTIVNTIHAAPASGGEFPAGGVDSTSLVNCLGSGSSNTGGENNFSPNSGDPSNLQAFFPQTGGNDSMNASSWNPSSSLQQAAKVPQPPSGTCRLRNY